MSLKLYWNKVCPFVQRAWIACLEKSLPVELVYISLTEERPQWYKEINPRETVPTFSHDGKIILESMLIVQYIDETFAPVGSLYPGNAKTRYQINYFIEQFGEEVIGALYGLLMNEGSTEDRENATKALKLVNSLLEKQSASGPFFLGSTFSAADVAVVPFLDRFRHTLKAYRSYDIFEHAPRLKSQLEAALERSSVGQTSLAAEEYLDGYKGYAKQEKAPTRTFKVYSSPHCPFAERVRLTAALKSVEHEVIDIDLENTPDWYRALNPSGSVPTLVTPDGESVLESALIVAYLEETFPSSGVSLRPAAAAARYEGRFFVDNANNFRNSFFGYLFAGESQLQDAKDASAAVNKLLVQQSNGPFFLGAEISEYDILIVTFLLRAYAVRNDFPGLLQIFDENTRLTELVKATRAHPIAGKVLRDDDFYRAIILELVNKMKK